MRRLIALFIAIIAALIGRPKPTTESQLPEQEPIAVVTESSNLDSESKNIAMDPAPEKSAEKKKEAAGTTKAKSIIDPALVPDVKEAEPTVSEAPTAEQSATESIPVQPTINESKSQFKKKDTKEKPADQSPEDPVPELISDETEPPVQIELEETKEEDTPRSYDEPAGNAPVYVNPAKGGPNPFEGGGDSKIENHDSSEFIREGDDRPGEGIHF